MTVKRVWTGLVMGFKEYARTPVLLALLLFLPAYMIGLFARVAPDSPLPVTIPEMGDASLAGSDVLTALMTPVAAALVSGLVGLFIIQSVEQTDNRLVVAGFSPADVVLARFGVLVGSCSLVTVISVGVAVTTFSPEQLGTFALGTFLAAVTYGLVGLLVGSAMSRLAGVYVILFLPLVDVVIFQNPMTEETRQFAEWLPGHYVTAVVLDAGFGPGFAESNLVWTGAYIVALTILTIWVYSRTVFE